MPETNDRLARIAKIPLSFGSHKSIKDGACIMEAVSFIAGEEWSDSPECASPVISAFLRSWNDSLDGERRDTLLRPLIPKLIGTRGDDALENRRATMAADWLVRVHTPAWLRLAGLTVHADALSALPEITDFAQCPSLMSVLSAARSDAAAARNAARAAAWAAAWAAAGDAAGDAAWDAAWAAARAAAWDAARDAVRAAAGDAAWAAVRAAVRAAAGDAAWDAARDAARAALKGTVAELQQSALALVERMIDAGASR